MIYSFMIYLLLIRLLLWNLTGCIVPEKFKRCHALPELLSESVTMDNPVVVSELLKKSRDLKNSTDHSAVYLKPDRTVEQQRKHRELVNKLKQSIKDSPDKRHFIRNGEVCHEENVKMDKADVPAKSESSGPGVTRGG